jgi:hypothetical protein
MTQDESSIDDVDKYKWLTEKIMGKMLRVCEVKSVRWARHKNGQKAIKPTKENPEPFGPLTAEEIKKRHDWIFYTHTLIFVPTYQTIYDNPKFPEISIPINVLESKFPDTDWVKVANTHMPSF